MATMKDISRQEWDGKNTVESINAGSLQRIACAAELMAVNHAELIRDRDRYKRDWLYQKNRADGLEKRISALKGVATKLRAEIETLTGTTTTE